MTANTENSSLPILLGLAAAVLLTVAGGWFLFEDGIGDEPVRSTEASVEIIDPTLTDVDGLPSGDEEGEVLAFATIEEIDEDTVIAVDEIESVESTDHGIEAILRKARLAAEADMLVTPTDQSAFFYYYQILEIDAQHEIARAELETVLSRVAQMSSAYMAAGDYVQAHSLALLVGQKNPGHSLVQDVATELDRMTDGYVEQAFQFVQEGNDDEAVAVLAAAESLPGRNAEYFSAVRESIDNIRNSRIAEEQSSLETIRLAAIQEVTAWTEKVRAAIATGRLRSPENDNAMTYLAERETPQVQKAQLIYELTSALLADCEQELEAGRIENAEQTLAAAKEYLGDNGEVVALQASIHRAHIAEESAKILTLEDFVRVDITPARYPRRALEREVQGSVDVLFTVLTNGATSDIEIVSSEPPDTFNEVAVEAVAQWTFEPRIFRGESIAQRTGARLVFQVE